MENGCAVSSLVKHALDGRHKSENVLQQLQVAVDVSGRSDIHYLLNSDPRETLLTDIVQKWQDTSSYNANLQCSFCPIYLPSLPYQMPKKIPVKTP